MIIREEDFKGFDFEKAKRCGKSPHPSYIGLWSHWWLKLNDKGFVRDGGRNFYFNEEDSKEFGQTYTRPDLNFLDENENLTGVIEVENVNQSSIVEVHTEYIKKADFLFCQLNSMREEFNKIKFAILMIWQEDTPKWEKGIEKLKKHIKKKSKKLKDNQIFVLVNLLWEVNKKEKINCADNEELIIYEKKNPNGRHLISFNGK